MEQEVEVSVEESGDRFRELEEAYRDYTVYDQHYERVGRVDDLFVDENDQPEYIGVKTGLLGMKSTLIPMEIARVNDRRKLIEVAVDRHTITEGPAFDDDEEITRDHEARIYGYYGLQHPGFQEGTGGYGDYYASETEGRTGDDLAGAVDTEYGQRREESLEDSRQGTPTGEPAPDHPDTSSAS
ncbi:MAG: PRC-barrel domain-containing protein, partial [Rubrobacteraceae bacterium]